MGLPGMVTPEEIGKVAVFASLDEAKRERLSRVAADIGLVAGEYAAREGDERALFAVLGVGSSRSRWLTGSSA